MNLIHFYAYNMIWNRKICQGDFLLQIQNRSIFLNKHHHVDNTWNSSFILQVLSLDKFSILYLMIFLGFWAKTFGWYSIFRRSASTMILPCFTGCFYQLDSFLWRTRQPPSIYLVFIPPVTEGRPWRALDLKWLDIYLNRSIGLALATRAWPGAGQSSGSRSERWFRNGQLLSY